MKIPALKHLLAATEKSEHRNHRHATLVLRGGSLVAIGYNRSFQHSEVNALNHLWPNKRAGTTLINLRITRGGLFGMARPCPECREYLKSNKVGKVIYFNGDEWIMERVK